jgi:hypothetical protein
MSFGTPEETVVFWKDPSVVMALQGSGNAVVVSIHAIKSSDWGLLLSSVGIITSMGFWLYRRIKTGMDPKNPAKEVTLTKRPF